MELAGCSWLDKGMFSYLTACVCVGLCTCLECLHRHAAARMLCISHSHG